MSHNDFDPYSPPPEYPGVDGQQHEYSSRVIHKHASFPPLRGMVTPSELNFGSIDVGNTSGTQTITVVNTGIRPLPIKEIRSSGSFVVSNNCPEGGELAPGATCSINVLFNPTQEGLLTGSVYVDTGDAAGTEYVSLLGSGGGDSNGILWVTHDELDAALETKADADHTHPVSDLEPSGATNGQVLTFNSVSQKWEPETLDIDPGGPSGGVSQTQFDQAIGALFTSLQGKQDVQLDGGGSTPTIWVPKVITGSNLASTTQAIVANTKTSIDFNAANFVNSDSDYLSIAKSGIDTRFYINVPAGKRAYYRFTLIVLVDQSNGSNVAHITGLQQIRQSTMATEVHLQIGEQISPLLNYATVISSSFVGTTTYPIILVPWVVTTAAARLASSSANGFSTHAALEIFLERPL